MQNEVALVPDQLKDMIGVDPFKRRNAVVVIQPNGAFGVESAHDSIMSRCLPERMGQAAFVTQGQVSPRSGQKARSKRDLGARAS